MGMEGRTAVRPSGITPDFHAAFKQTWYKNLIVEWSWGDKQVTGSNLGGQGCYRFPENWNL